MDLQCCLSEQDLSCPVCRDVFQDPVFLLCSHSFCRDCLQHFWKEKRAKECPVCRVNFPMEHLPCNLVLKNLCDSYLQERSQRAATSSEALCVLHSEKLKLFCLKDKQLACLVCRDSKKHKDHKFCPIDEAAQDLKEELKTWMRPLRENLATYEGIQQILNQRVKHLKSQARQTEMQIKEEFQVLYQFLQDEETARIAALREEEEQKSYMIMKKVQEIAYLCESVQAIETEMKMANIPFLENYSSTTHRSEDITVLMSKCSQVLFRARSTLKDPNMDSGKLINVAGHLRNLKFSVWQKMQGIIEYTPVTLDPNTAHPCLKLSDDLTSLRLCTEMQQLPDNPDRFEGYSSVLGSEGFNSGTHCWDVEVGDCTTWALGVVSESEYKNREQPSMFGLWYIGCSNGKYGKGYSTELLTPLTVNQKPQRVRVSLDWDGGRVTFSDAITGSLLHSFTHSFTEKVFPYFCNVSSVQALKILTLKPFVNL